MLRLAGLNYEMSAETRSEALRKFIVDYCHDNNLSTAALERKAGLTRDTIYSFVTGRATDFKLSTIIRIADVLGMSLDELVDREATFARYLGNITDLPIEPGLFQEITEFVTKHCLMSRANKYSIKDAFSAVHEIYEYCVKSKLNKMDKNFATWFCDNLNKNSKQK